MKDMTDFIEDNRDNKKDNLLNKHYESLEQQKYDKGMKDAFNLVLDFLDRRKE